MTPTRKLRLVILAGKGGGDFVAIERARRAGLVDFSVAGFFTTSSHSAALQYYRESHAGEPVIMEEFASQRESYFTMIRQRLEELEFDQVLLCGFTFLLPPQWVRKMEGRIINSHHSLLPAHPGLFKKEKLIGSDERFLGATLHLVDEGVDSGRILSQCVFPNPGMDHLESVLRTYRFAQDCMIVQLLRSLSGQGSSEASGIHEGVYFSPPLDAPVAQLFRKVHYQR